MSGRLAISASARGMAEDSSSSRQMKKTTKTYVMKTDSQGNVTTHTDVQVSGSGSSESGSGVFLVVIRFVINLFDSFDEEIRGADPSVAGGSRVGDDPQTQGRAREAGSPDAGFFYFSLTIL